ncbi:unnamed protein product [Closterium sp. NIES-53]
MATATSRVCEQQDHSLWPPSRGYHHQAMLLASPRRRLPTLLLLFLGFIAFCRNASLSLAVTVNSVQGEILEQCAVEMGVKGNTWSNTTTCGMEVGLRCNKDGTVNTIDLHNSNLTGTICSDIGKLTTLTVMSFRQNQFSGEIPYGLGNLTKLTLISFDINHFSGTVPPTLGNLVHLTSLEVLDSGAVCPTGAGQSCVVKQSPSSQFCYQCSEFCPSCIPIAEPTPPSPPPAPPPPPPSSGLSVGAIVGIALGGVLAAALLAGGVWLIYKRKSTAAHESSIGPKPSDGASRGGGASVPTQSLMCQRYPLAVVAKATDNWAEANHIGSGAYGEVYRGVCPDDPLVVWAVKRAKILTNDFKREVEEMASKSHPHLVRLLGYCVDMDATTEHYEQIVIYEFCSNGDLEKYLSGGPKKGTLTLQQRMDVLVGVARGLEYLHQFDIVHRDIKPANVLLDARMQPKVSDFGLVRMTEGTTVNPTRVVGTPGYVDPAYSRTSKVTPMADVYSFGVMMLEIMLTKPVVMQESGGINIRDWVDKRVQANDIESLKDSYLDSVPENLLLKLVELALQCTSLLGSSRPHMIDVVAQLGVLRRDFFEVQASTKDSRLLKIDKEVWRQGTGPQRSMEDELELLDGMLGGKSAIN